MIHTISLKCRHCQQQYDWAPAHDPPEARDFCSPECSYSHYAEEQHVERRSTMYTEQEVRDLIASLADAMNALDTHRATRRGLQARLDVGRIAEEISRARIVEAAAQGDGGLGKNEEERKRRTTLVLASNAEYTRLVAELDEVIQELRYCDDQIARESDRFSKQRTAARLIAAWLNYAGGQ